MPSSIFRDMDSRPVVWLREPDHDILCPVCVFESGSHQASTAFCYRCVRHFITGLIGDRVYHCPYHQRSVTITDSPCLDRPLKKALTAWLSS